MPTDKPLAEREPMGTFVKFRRRKNTYICLPLYDIECVSGSDKTCSVHMKGGRFYSLTCSTDEAMAAIHDCEHQLARVLREAEGKHGK